MARANIYIRKENEEAWEGLLDKSEWVNYHLTERSTKGETSPIDTLNEIDEIIEEVDSKDYSLCKHDAVKGMCKKGCR